MNINTEDKITRIVEKFQTKCPTCGTPCRAVITDVQQGKLGGSTAVYTPLTNTNSRSEV